MAREAGLPVLLEAVAAGRPGRAQQAAEVAAYTIDCLKYRWTGLETTAGTGEAAATTAAAAVVGGGGGGGLYLAEVAAEEEPETEQLEAEQPHVDGSDGAAAATAELARLRAVLARALGVVENAAVDAAAGVRPGLESTGSARGSGGGYNPLERHAWDELLGVCREAAALGLGGASDIV
eukprot:SAG11_NODE_372_length_10036_cov_8.820871_12_plen_179_part_00